MNDYENRRLRERRAIKLLVLSLLLERHCGEQVAWFKQHYDDRTAPDEIAGTVLLLLDGDAKRRALTFALEMLDLLGLRFVNDTLCNTFQINLLEVPGAAEMIKRLPDQSPRVLIDTVLAPDEAFGGRDMIEMIRLGDHASFNRCLRQLAGDGFG